MRVAEYLLHLERAAGQTREEAKARGEHAPAVRRDSHLVETAGWEIISSVGAPALYVRPCPAPTAPFDVDDDGTVIAPRPRREQTDAEWLRSMFR